MKKLCGIKLLPSDTAYSEMNSPVGNLIIMTSSQGLHAVLWDTKGQEIVKQIKASNNEKIILETKKQLTEYFVGKRKLFDLPLVLNGTPFQNEAWKKLLEIPYANTISYKQQAEKIGNQNKSRAVGRANGLNPISIIVPCHRVVGSNGALVGFGGGLDKKAYLLELEQKYK